MPHCHERVPRRERDGPHAAAAQSSGHGHCGGGAGVSRLGDGALVHVEVRVHDALWPRLRRRRHRPRRCRPPRRQRRREVRQRHGPGERVEGRGVRGDGVERQLILTGGGVHAGSLPATEAEDLHSFVQGLHLLNPGAVAELELCLHLSAMGLDVHQVLHLGLPGLPDIRQLLLGIRVSGKVLGELLLLQRDAVLQGLNLIALRHLQGRRRRGVGRLLLAGRHEVRLEGLQELLQDAEDLLPLRRSGHLRAKLRQACPLRQRHSVAQRREDVLRPREKVLEGGIRRQGAQDGGFLRRQHRERLLDLARDAHQARRQVLAHDGIALRGVAALQVLLVLFELGLFCGVVTRVAALVPRPEHLEGVGERGDGLEHLLFALVELRPLLVPERVLLVQRLHFLSQLFLQSSELDFQRRLALNADFHRGHQLLVAGVRGGDRCLRGGDRGLAPGHGVPVDLRVAREVRGDLVADALQQRGHVRHGVVGGGALRVHVRALDMRLRHLGHDVGDGGGRRRDGLRNLLRRGDVRRRHGAACNSRRRHYDRRRALLRGGGSVGRHVDWRVARLRPCRALREGAGGGRAPAGRDALQEDVPHLLRKLHQHVVGLLQSGHLLLALRGQLLEGLARDARRLQLLIGRLRIGQGLRRGVQVGRGVLQLRGVGGLHLQLELLVLICRHHHHVVVRQLLCEGRSRLDLFLSVFFSRARGSRPRPPAALRPHLGSPRAGGR
mmetsp:Transcript_129627/g.414690  ORF Transcript_129627/g.414690 Transcript_129627/m.414690 type:complete len:724 (-) Transcript_129627:2132-4303(-)